MSNEDSQPPRSFRVQLRRAALIGRISGRINRDEWRRIRKIVKNPVQKVNGKNINLLEEIYEEVTLNAMDNEKIEEFGELYGLDFISILNAIIDALPMILELIETLLNLFGEEEKDD